VDLASDLSQFSQAASQNGWATAGAYYWTIARLSERSARLLYNTATFSGGDPPIDGEALEDFEAVYDRLGRYLSGAFRPERAVSAEGPKAEFPSVDWFLDQVSGSLGRYGLSSLVQKLSAGDPVPVLAGLGRFMVTSAETIIGLRVGTATLAAAAGTTTDTILGKMASVFTGSISSAVAGGAVGAVEAMGPYLLILSLLLISYGFMLAYFLPALPFIIWLAGLLAWLISVLEALAAAPLWVAAHALPEGEGLAGAAGRRGYFLFLGVLLRPPMMILGFLLAMALLNGIGRVVGEIFSIFGFDRLGESFLGISGFLAFAVILGLCAVTATWKLFSLSVNLPDRVMAWIGGQSGSQGEVEEARRNQGGYQAAGSLATKIIEPMAITKNKPTGTP
jgi:conjugal transfer/type IV secretion protein DotA/TraY